MFRRRLFSSSLIEVFINGQPVQAPAGSTIIQACKLAGIDIPRFCYHERLAIAGNCRMCLVHVEKVPKLVASCAQPIAPAMRIFTNSDEVKKARESVMEFLLANHPLDCPICDQGGECDLQDQAMAFGSDRSRYRLDVQGKRAVEDKHLGPLIKTSMNRCIHCTRCVRFANEVAGVDDLGTTGRGNDMQIGTYVEKTIRSELSGNLIDLCPVGALTSRPYAFQARPWELKKTESIDVMDAMGSAIRIDSRGPRVYRILPRENAAINEEWLADKSRFACDALSLQRLTRPLIRNHQGSFEQAEWADALSLVASKMNNSKKLQALIGDFADAESVWCLKQLFAELGSDRLALDVDNPGVDLASSGLSFMNPKITDFDDADAVLIIGSNTKHEAPLLNARIRKSYLNRPVMIGLCGPKTNLTFEYEHLEIINDDFMHRFGEARKPLLLIGQSALQSHAKVIKTIIESCGNLIYEAHNGVAVLNRVASRAAALEMSIGTHGYQPDCDFLYLLNSGSPHPVDPGTFVVYQGHHGDADARMATVILPGAAYTEKSATFVNVEGRVQRTECAVPPPGNAREDWQIVRALAEFCGRRLPVDQIESIREALGPIGRANTLLPRAGRQAILTNLEAMHALGKDSSFRYPIEDYYLTDVISRLSPTMAACSREFSGGKNLLE